MNPALRHLLDRHDGVLSRAVVLEVLPHHVLDHAVAAGQVMRVFPRVYVERGRHGEPPIRRRAAVAHAGGDGALSHLSALAVWELPVPATARVHLITGSHRQLRHGGDLTVHRRAGFVAGPPHAVLRHGLPVTRLERSVVDSWPLLRGDAQRAPAIRAVADRRTTADRLLTEARRAIRLPGRRQLLALLGKLAAGCRSELELWGYDHVLRGPGVPPFAWQVPIDLGGRTVHLDAYRAQERVAVELDGARWHASPADRERDLRRDAALAARGIMVVRYTYQRLMTEPAAVQAELLAVLAARR